MVVLDNSILNVALPRIRESFGASESDLQWIATSYGLVLAGLLLPIAVMGDRRGRKGSLLIGLGIFGTASTAAGFSHSALTLAAWRGAMGVGGACAMPATLSLIGNLFPEGERGRAIAIWSAVAGVAGAGGPVIGGLLLERFWWGSVLLVNAPVAAVAVLAGAWLLPTSRDPRSPTLDGRSSMLWWGALSCALLTIIEGPVRGWTSPGVIAPGFMAALLLVAFRRNEARSPRPLVAAETARDPRMRSGVVTMSALFFVLFGSQFVVAQWLQGPRDLRPAVAALCLSPNAVASLSFALVNPRWVRRWGHGPVISGGLVALSAGASVAAAAIGAGNIIGAGVGMALLGVGVGIASPSAVELIMSSAPPARAGSAAGVNETIVEAAGALGVAALGSILAALHSYALALPLAAAVAGAAAVTVGGSARSLNPQPTSR
jgi:MFS family permease